MDATIITQDPSQGQSVVTSKQAQVEVIAVPMIPFHSHLDQLLHFSCLISSSYSIPVHFATTATHLRQAKLRFNSQTHLQNPHIRFHELPTPPFLSPPPDPNSPNKFPSHLQPTFEASMQLRHPMAELLREVSATARRVVVIHDAFMAYVVQDMATLPNVESYIFSPIPAFHGLLRELKDDHKYPHFFEELKAIPSIEGCLPPEFINLVVPSVAFLSLAAGTIFNSCRSIEGTYLDLLEKEMTSINKKVWAIGPLNSDTKGDKTKSNSRQHRCLEWLDKQAPKSVLYVSFGTTITMADEQIKELALGLEQSKQKFLWVLRDADKGDIFARDVERSPLPNGYEERVKEFGMVVRDWAPQVDILGHPSTGGFMSHCGWNSCLESMTVGVPILAWPMHSDQPRNAFQVTNILKVGLAVITWEQREQIVTSSTICEVVKMLMASREGEEIRRKVEEIGGAAQQAVKEGGVSRLELDSFITHITR
ncbi:zeatin O-glucosyltransferase-like isoform X1 [Rhododendron vialii]|uniref:zeatin O-glucosyltransferase-like isoform X1 n=1 Tax=Rhododendron vialii TaxID=182163 RepID=UPI00265DBF3A|nr:zeatin O-glucosyltransferase-like isoform X1 [Rhododendron vialii]